MARHGVFDAKAAVWPGADPKDDCFAMKPAQQESIALGDSSAQLPTIDGPHTVIVNAFIDVPCDGNLRLAFRCLKATKRGGVQLKVQSSDDFGVADPWTNHEAAVPDGDGTVNGVVIDTMDDGDSINVIADIPATGARLFGGLSGVSAP